MPGLCGSGEGTQGFMQAFYHLRPSHIPNTEVLLFENKPYFLFSWLDRILAFPWKGEVDICIKRQGQNLTIYKISLCFPQMCLSP